MTEDGYEDNSNFDEGKTLLIDADTIAYKACSFYNEEGEGAKALTLMAVDRIINDLVNRSGCADYKCYLTTKTNFRHFLIDTYKANRADKEPPINLGWCKGLIMKKYNGVACQYLEADDLISLSSSPNTVIYSIDKDLRQIEGFHFDSKENEIIHIDSLGTLKQGLKNKIIFSGLIGFYYQLLVGDTSDNILGCGIRESHIYKTGAKAGQPYIKRKGVTPTQAVSLLAKAVVFKEKKENLESIKKTVIKCYMNQFGRKWEEVIETQANLLFLPKQRIGNWIKMWTHDNREKWLEITTGATLNEIPKADKD